MPTRPGSISNMPISVSLPSPARRSSRFRPSRRGWSGEGDFNYDFGVSFTQEDREAGRALYNFGLTTIQRASDMFGLSVFIKDERGDIFHSYSTYHRGTELLMGAFNWLDSTPKGRNETDGTMCWVKLHDEY